MTVVDLALADLCSSGLLSSSAFFIVTSFATILPSFVFSLFSATVGFFLAEITSSLEGLGSSLVT